MTNIHPIAGALAAAEPAAPVAGAEPAPVTGQAEPPADKGEKPKRKRHPRVIHQQLHWPDDMPVDPLGLQGDVYFYLDEARQLRAIPVEKHGRATIFSLFGRKADVLLRHWHKTNKDGEQTFGFHADLVANALMNACANKGLIDPARQLRMPGAWADEQGRLVLHLGDKVLIDGTYHEPGQFGPHIYPAAPPTMKPAVTPESTDAGAELEAIVGTWHWRAPIMRVLVVGWIMQSFFTGALPWRSHIQLDGGAGTGKSELLKLIRGLLGDWMLSASNVTPAAIYQLMQGRAQPLFLDEFEAGANAKRKIDVVALLREASSGGMVLRGGDDHVGKRFSLQFGAFLTSIVPVSLQSQDETRMVKLTLDSLETRPEPFPAPNLDPVRLRKLGARLMRRAVDVAPRWRATSNAYRKALEELAGFSSRQQDTYGTLLALYDLALFDGDPAQHMDAVENIVLAVKAIVRPQLDEQDADQDRCLAHLLQSTVERGMGARRTVSSWLRDACAIDDDGNPDRPKRNEAIAALGAIGLKPMVTRAPNDQALLPPEQRALFVVNEHPGLARLFMDTPWPGEPGAIGAWVTALRRCQGAMAAQPQRVAGLLRRGTIVPVARLMPWDDDVE